VSQALQIIGAATVAFLSTSVDNLSVLVGLFAARDLRPRRVAFGYVGASWIMTGAAWGGSKALDMLPAADLGFLGVIPLGLGIQRAWALRRSAADVALPVPTDGGIVATALLTFAQSADNLGVYTAIFADSKSALDGLVFVTLAGCATGWWALAFWLARNSPVAGALQRSMRFVLPLLLIAVGIYILSDTVTDVTGRVASERRSSAACHLVPERCSASVPSHLPG